MLGERTLEQVWLPVIAKSLAYLCLNSTQIANQTIAEKARFLEGLGLDRKDVAEMLGTSTASVSELLRIAKKKKIGGRKIAKKTKR